jgi:hypothetical protein
MSKKAAAASASGKTSAAAAANDQTLPQKFNNLFKQVVVSHPFTRRVGQSRLCELLALL